MSTDLFLYVSNVGRQAATDLIYSYIMGCTAHKLCKLVTSTVSTTTTTQQSNMSSMFSTLLVWTPDQADIGLASFPGLRSDLFEISK